MGLLQGWHCGLQLYDAASVIMVDMTSRPEGSMGGTWPTGKQRWMSPDGLPGLARLGHRWSWGCNLMLREAIESHCRTSLMNAPTAPVVGSLMRKL